MRVFAAVDFADRFRYFPRERQRFWCRKSGVHGVFDKLGVTGSSPVSPTFTSENVTLESPSRAWHVRLSIAGGSRHAAPLDVGIRGPIVNLDVASRRAMGDVRNTTGALRRPRSARGIQPDDGPLVGRQASSRAMFSDSAHRVLVDVPTNRDTEDWEKFNRPSSPS